MSESELSDNVKKLLHDSLGSLDELAVTLFLYTHSERDWTCSSIARELKMPEALVAETLGSLAHEGLLRRLVGTGGEPLFGCHPAESAVCVTVNELIRTYRTDPLEVVKLLTASAMERMRTSALRTFSNAFLWQKKKSNG